MARQDRQDRLDIPGRGSNLWLSRVRFDRDVFGSFAEEFARFMGTAGFLIWMSIFIVAWILWNIYAPESLAPDRFPFIFLTLVLSLQASYAAPLILLAPDRLEARDRVSLEHDREVAAQSRADMDFLAREIASLRLRVNDLATRDFIRAELRELLAELDPEAEADSARRK